jgi:arsenate reductase (glutaredoxin)
MSPVEITLYHNPRCTKSREALALLRSHGIEPTIVEYLKTPPTLAELTDIVKRLGVEPQALVRKSEDVFKQSYQGKQLDTSQWIAAIAAHPILLERPIAVRGTRAVIGRPPERVLELL